MLIISIYFIYLSWSLLPKSTLLAWLRLLLKLGDPFQAGAFLPHWRWPSNNPEQKILANNGGVETYTPAYTYLQNIKKPFRWWWVKPGILLNLVYSLLVGTFLPQWRWQQLTRAKNPCQQWWGSSPYIHFHLLKVQKTFPVVVGTASYVNKLFS